jgi:ribosome-binding protein aMBF1 (putative translation factor)
VQRHNGWPKSRNEEERVKLSDLKTQDEVLHEQLADPEFHDEWDRTALARAVAERLVTYRAKRELTQTGLARLLMMQQPAIARLESGEHTPSLDTLWRLASRLGIEFHIDITAQGVAI